MFKIFNIFLMLVILDYGSSEFEKCAGTCVPLKDCPEAQTLFKQRRTYPQICGFIGIESYICCPEKDERTSIVVKSDVGLRKADKRCKELRPPAIYHNYGEDEDYEELGYLGEFVEKSSSFKFMTALGYGSSENPVYRCGAFLIEKNVVITAAHCTELNGQPPSVARIGNYHLQSNETQPIKILKIIVHPNYNSETYLNDIAIIILAENSKHKPACLYTQRLNLRHDNQTIAVGFGTTSFAGRFSERLIKVNLNIIDRKVCVKEYQGQPIVNSQLCVLGERKTFENGTSGLQDTCQGDSGGPLVLKRNSNYVVGIISYGRSCGAEVPAIYTYITSYLDWIDSVIRQQGNEKGLHKCQTLKPPYLTVRTCYGVEKTDPRCTATLIGSEIETSDFSSMATLGYVDSKNLVYKCDGVLIEKNIILTAAHCAKLNGNSPILAKIVDFKIGFDKISPIRIVKVISHPKYDENSNLNDIAIIFLAENSKAEPACLKSSSLDHQLDNEIYSVSFGTTLFDGILSTKFIKVRMNITDKSICKMQQKQNNTVNDSEFCTFGKTDYLDEDTYQSNVGGPLYIVSNNMPISVVGILSYGNGYGFYTNITYHLDWIESVVWPEGTRKERFYIA